MLVFSFCVLPLVSSVSFKGASSGKEADKLHLLPLSPPSPTLHPRSPSSSRTEVEFLSHAGEISSWSSRHLTEQNEEGSTFSSSREMGRSFGKVPLLGRRGTARTPRGWLPLSSSQSEGEGEKGEEGEEGEDGEDGCSPTLIIKTLSTSSVEAHQYECSPPRRSCRDGGRGRRQRGGRAPGVEVIPPPVERPSPFAKKCVRCLGVSASCIVFSVLFAAAYYDPERYSKRHATCEVQMRKSLNDKNCLLPSPHLRRKERMYRVKANGHCKEVFEEFEYDLACMSVSNFWIEDRLRFDGSQSD